ncbi:alpha/beta hydrolase [Rickettsiales bacterium]|nr:alpha/beta hydrolase [Rickettsiales bacterium]
MNIKFSYNMAGKYILKTMLACCLIFSILACSTINDRKATASKLATGNNLRKLLVRTDNFILTTYSKIGNDKRPIRVYIEGDGASWVTPRQLATNPTPRDPVALKLAAEDTAYPNILYIARPCQYTDHDLDKKCSSEYWFKKTFSQEVIDSFNQTIDYFNKNNNKISLIGYSGGAAVAILVAASRNDVASIRTVAGNLDHKAVTDLHNATFLDGSLNPINVAEKVKHIPQHHFSGAKDMTVPSDITKKFVQRARSNSGSCAQMTILPDMGHYKGWEYKWNDLLGYSLKCE